MIRLTDLTVTRTIASRVHFSRVDDTGEFVGVYEAKHGPTGESSFLVLEYQWDKRDVTLERMTASNPAFVLDPDGDSPCALFDTGADDTGPEPTETPEYAACEHTAWGD